MKKVILFGILGAVGCLLGWGIGELFLGRTLPMAASAQGKAGPSILTPPEPPQLANKPSIAEQLAVPTPAPPPTPEGFRAPKALEPPPPSAEFAQRLQREGAHEGDVQVALIWWNTSDLDLHVTDPAGEEIFFGHRRAQSGGELDVDMNVSYPLSNEPVEHVYFPTGGAPGGHYKVEVVCFSDRSSVANRYKVEVLANGERRDYEGSISNIGRGEKARNFVSEFDVHLTPPELRLSVPETISILPGGSNEFRVRIARGYFDGAVNLRLDWGGGFNANSVSIPAGETAASLTIHADDTLTPGQKTTRLTASADTPRGHVEAVANLRLTVVTPKKPEPVLKLSVPAAVQILQNDRNRLKVRVGRYFFSSSPAVKLRLSTDDTELQGNEPLIAADSDEAIFEVKAMRTAKPGKHEVALIGRTMSSPEIEARQNLSVDVIKAPIPAFNWPLVGVVGMWTALLAIALSLFLVIGQNWYLGRNLIAPRQSLMVLVGGLGAGLIAGGGGQALLAWLGRLEASTGTAAPPELGQIAGWCLLGVLLGYGLAFYIPNLSGSRAALAGGIGGILGVTGFLLLTHFVGPVVGRLIGAMVLGFAIGSMVALVEVAFREAWLEIRYGAKETRNVSLGAEPIAIGSDQSACTVYAANAPPIAYRYWLKDNAIYCEDAVAKRASTIVPGNQKQIGNLVATVCATGKVAAETTAKAAHARGATPKARFSLRLSNGQSISLANGTTFSATDLPGLHSVPPGGPVAIVNPHPTDPAIQGLQNLSHLPWRVHLANGDSIEVKPQKNVRLAAGTRINFGSIEGEIRS